MAASSAATSGRAMETNTDPLRIMTLRVFCLDLFIIEYSWKSWVWSDTSIDMKPALFWCFGRCSYRSRKRVGYKAMQTQPHPVQICGNKTHPKGIKELILDKRNVLTTARNFTRSVW